MASLHNIAEVICLARNADDMTGLEPQGTPCGTCGSGYGKALADARALWSVRVLDAWAASKGRYWSTHARNGSVRGCTLTAPLVCVDWERATDDAARLAAATAILHELPEDVRREIGERP